MLLDGDGVTRQLQHVFIAQRKTRLVGGRYRLDTTRATCRALLVEHHALLFGTQTAADNGREARGELLLVHIEFIGIDSTLHHHFTQTER